jgi:predicted site-specific integrase-resolvase
MTTSQIERVLSLPEAARRMGLSVEALTRLVRSGKILALRLPDGSLAVSEKRAKRGATTTTTPSRKEDMPEYKRHAHLRGVEISINEASRKYRISNSTIVRWTNSGYIARIRRVGQRVFIDEADMAYCAEVHKARGGQGRWLFNQDGTPYTPKTAK